jgi:hypothetical protein
MNSTAKHAAIILTRLRPCRKKAKSAARNAAAVISRNFTERRTWGAISPIPEPARATRAAEEAVRAAAVDASPDSRNGTRIKTGFNRFLANF